MEHWFTTEAIDSETTAISEYRHWEQVHSYLLRGQRRALLIDSGLGVGDIGAVVRQLTALPVTVATTHVHWDHIGGHRHFCDFTVHRAEVDWLAKKFPIPLQVVRQNLTRGGQVFPAGFDRGPIRCFAVIPAECCATATASIWAGGRSRCCTRRATPPGTCAFTSRHGATCSAAI